MNTEVVFQVSPSRITYVARVLEGYEHLGVVTTIDPQIGIARVRATEDTAGLVKKILKSLPIDVHILQ